MLSLIVYIALIGLVVWVITTLVPMDVKFKQIIIVIAVVCVVLLVLNAFGVLTALDRPVPHLR